MKHPVDTSTWGEFKVGELFDVHPTKAYKLKNSDLLSVDGEIPVVVNSSYNNGIGGYSKLEPTEQPGVLTFSDTTSGSNTLFYQNQSFIGYAHVQGMYPKNFELTDLTALFMIATLRATIDQRKWDYTNKLNRTTVIEMHVRLPLKPTANSSDYTQEDIDWDYMESFMLRVQDAAKERLANLPKPGQKSKTPVDTSTWGEFKVGELFDVHPTKAYKLKNSDLLSVDGEIPVVVNSSYNNGIGGYSKLEPTEQPGVLTFSDTTSGSNTLFYQNQSFIGYAHVQGMYPKNFELTDLTALFMIATLRATIDQRKWDYTNKLNRTTVIEMHVRLPLKPTANSSDYTQEDIDWDYMESFMLQFQNLAKNRLEQLSEKIKA